MDLSAKKSAIQIFRSFGGYQITKRLAIEHPRVIMYHRIGSRTSEGGISIDQFRRQVRILKENFATFTLKDFLSFPSSDRPKNAVIVTFDDGYDDFEKNAFPILKEFDVPATLFITTGFINGDLWLWPDMLRYALENTSEFEIRIDGFDRPFNVASKKDDCWKQLANHCLVVGNSEKHRIIREVYQKTGVEIPARAPLDYKGLTWEKLREMSLQGLNVESHSFSHPILTRISNEELKKELVLSRMQIKKNLGVSSTIFCYPNGQIADFDQNVKKSVLEAGYRYAVAAFPGPSPFKDFLAINRYPAQANVTSFLKTVYGVSYLRMLMKTQIRELFGP